MAVKSRYEFHDLEYEEVKLRLKMWSAEKTFAFVKLIAECIELVKALKSAKTNGAANGAHTEASGPPEGSDRIPGAPGVREGKPEPRAAAKRIFEFEPESFGRFLATASDEAKSKLTTIIWQSIDTPELTTAQILDWTAEDYLSVLTKVIDMNLTTTVAKKVLGLFDLMAQKVKAVPASPAPAKARG